MEIRAKAKYLKVSPQKARILASCCKNKQAQKACQELKLRPQKSNLLIYKLINSAIANAENNYNLKKDNLIVSQIIIEEGPSYKRIKPRARGGRDIVKKRTTHVTVILTSTEPSKAEKEAITEKKPKEKAKEIKQKIIKPKKKEPKKEKKVVKKKKAEVQVETKTEIKKPSPMVKEEKKPLREKKSFFQRIFRRKGGM